MTALPASGAGGPASGDLAPGAVVDEYEVVYKLGQGGMGAVYRARHTLLGKDVALKVIAPHRAADPRFKTRFFREAKVALEFVHRHAIPLRDFGVAEGGLCYMTMDFSPGVPLGALVRREGPLPVARACRLLCQMLEALADAHRKRIVHRDLKPDNVLVETDEHGGDFVKVLDFGLAKMAEEDRSPGRGDPSPTPPAEGSAALAQEESNAVVVGTPSYMAPEQASGEPVDARADLYACGVILFYLVTGKLPFQAVSSREVILQHLAKPPPALADARPEVAFPWGFEAALRRALEKKADARWLSAEDMGDALEPFATPRRRRGSTGTMKVFREESASGASPPRMPAASGEVVAAPGAHVLVPGITAQDDTRSPAPIPLGGREASPPPARPAEDPARPDLARPDEPARADGSRRYLPPAVAGGDPRAGTARRYAHPQAPPEVLSVPATPAAPIAAAPPSSAPPAPHAHSPGPAPPPEVPSPIPGHSLDSPSPVPGDSDGGGIEVPHTPATPRAPVHHPSSVSGRETSIGLERAGPVLASSGVHGGLSSAISSPSGARPGPVQIGEVIDRYRVLEKIAEGSFGIVYRAEHTEMNRPCALKVIRPEIATDPAFVERFRREAKVTARFRHPSAVEVHDCGGAGGRLFMAMELLPGGSLAQRLRDEGHLPLRDAVEVALQVLDCLEAAHRQGIVHRDLKPANIVLGEVDGWRNQVKVLDFGIAKARDTVYDPAGPAAEQSAFGTPHYASPEQCRGEARADGRSDLYAVGVMLFEMLAGRLPFDARTPEEVVRAHLSAEPRRLEEARPGLGVPDEVEEVIRRALAKDPDARFPSARAMEDALRLASEVSTIFEASERGVRPARPRETTRRFHLGGWRRLALASLLGAVLVVAALQVAGFMRPLVAGRAVPDIPGGADDRAAAEARAAWERAVREDPAGVWARARAAIEAKDGLRARGRIDEAVASARRFAALDGELSPGEGKPLPEPLRLKALAAVRAEAQALARSLETIAPLHRDMILVPAGDVIVGSDRWQDDERPEHRVALRAFFLDSTEVSRADFALFLEDGTASAGVAAPEGFQGRRPAPGTERLPVAGVTHAEAAAFARWAGKRLPSEAEWERAARGPLGRLYPWGETWDVSSDPTRALIKATRAAIGRAPLEVDSTEADNRDPEGWKHLAGNVAEWTSSLYRSYPKNPRPRADTGTLVVARGGDFETTVAPTGCRGSARTPLPPDTRSAHVGFRCAKDAE